MQIQNRTISLLGVGSVGSTLADLLAKAGIGGLLLFDVDGLKTGNVIRHTSGIEHFGEPKVDSTYLHIVQHNPFVKISRNFINLSDSYHAVETSISGSDIAISSTANEALETVVNEVAVLKRQTVYYVRAMRGGTTGRIFRVIPGRDACRHCLYLHMKDTESEIGSWLTVPDDEDSLLGFECGNPILAASGTDLGIISSLCSKIVLGDLGENFGDENHWLWTTEAIGGHSALSQAYKLVPRRIDPFPNCAFCSEPEINEINIPPGVQSKIEELAIRSGANETGGVLVGVFNGRAALVTDASEAGPNAICSPAKFVKDIPYTQNWLENKVKNDPSIEYVGEWHSHTNGDTTPSVTDVTSLNGIADSAGYLCRTPVMLILGTGGDDRRVVEKSAFGFSQERPFRKIGYKILG